MKHIVLKSTSLPTPSDACYNTTTMKNKTHNTIKTTRKYELKIIHKPSQKPMREICGIKKSLFKKTTINPVLYRHKPTFTNRTKLRKIVPNGTIQGFEGRS